MSDENKRDWIGGSNIAGILGVSPFRTPLQEYLTIIGEAEPPPEDDLKFFARRKRVEPFVLDLLESEHGLKIARRNERYTDKQHPFLKAEIDAELDDGRNVEVKSVHPYASRGWGREATEDSIPLYVLAQAQWGLPFTGAVEALVVPQVGFDDTRLLPTRRDDELISMMRLKAATFWFEHVLVRRPPPPSNLQDTRLLWQRSVARTVVASDSVRQAVQQLTTAKEAIKQLETDADAAKLEIQTALGEADTLITPDGQVLVTWRKSADARVFDRARLEAEHPEIFAQYQTTRPGSRRLLTK